jgi:hypothetical protein
MSEGSGKVSDSPLGTAERLELLVPGFRGYKMRDLIRQDDVLVRSAISVRLAKAQEKVRQVEGEVAEKDPFDARVHDYELLLSKMRLLTEEVGAAPAGALSYYARFKFTEQSQKDLVDFDLKLLTMVDALLQSVRSSTAQGINEQCQAIRDEFFERNKIFFPATLRE